MKALVWSGGGSKGAYGVGVMNHLLGDLQIQYDIICGVSVGAINGSFLAQYHHGQEKLAASDMSKMWSGLNTSKIYKRWMPFGILHALWNKSFYDSSPLRKLIRTHVLLDKIRDSDRKVYVGTVSLSSGKYTIFDQTSDHFIDAVIASASFPTMLEPVSFMGQLWADGGIKEISPLKKAVELGADVIDVIITNPVNRMKKFLDNPTTVDILKRSIDLSTDKIMANDVEKVEMYNKMALMGLTEKKYVQLNIIRPENNLIEDLLDFRPFKIQEMMEKGYQDAVAKYIM